MIFEIEIIPFPGLPNQYISHNKIADDQLHDEFYDDLVICGSEIKNR